MDAVGCTWLDQKKFLKRLGQQSRQFAVLCGSGISAGAGLPPAREFMTCVFDSYVGEKIRSKLLEAELPESVQLRFEGLLEVLQRTVDEDLELVDLCYFVPDKGLRVPNELHYYLAALSKTHPVVTPNFDILIEEAMRRPPSHSDHSDWPALVRVREKDWKRQQEAPSHGLWKIHGSIRVWDTVVSDWAPPGDVAPVVTLRSVSRTRRDEERHRVFKAILEKYPLLVVGYFGGR